MVLRAGVKSHLFGPGGSDILSTSPAAQYALGEAPSFPKMYRAFFARNGRASDISTISHSAGKLHDLKKTGVCERGRARPPYGAKPMRWGT